MSIRLSQRDQFPGEIPLEHWKLHCISILTTSEGGMKKPGYSWNQHWRRKVQGLQLYSLAATRIIVVFRKTGNTSFRFFQEINCRRWSYTPVGPKFAFIACHPFEAVKRNLIKFSVFVCEDRTYATKTLEIWKSDLKRLINRRIWALSKLIIESKREKI